MKTLVRTISEAWGWIGLQPKRVVDTNAFGNAIVEDVQGKYWLIETDTTECEIISESNNSFDLLKAGVDFEERWEMTGLLSLPNLN